MTKLAMIMEAIDKHRNEIASELGIDLRTDGEYQPVRNANAAPGTPLSARTGRLVTKADLQLEP